MIKHIDDARLNDYLEGLLPQDAARPVDEHLAACEECSVRLERLTLLLSELAELPDEAAPARDLWSGVRASIDAGSGRDEDVLQHAAPDRGGVPTRSRGGWMRTRRFSFSASQLAAASVVWTLLSGGAVWMAFSARPDQTIVAAAGPTAVDGVPTTSSKILPVVDAATAEYEQAIASLESVLERGRDQLAPQTLRVIEASLATIDQAIREARQALADDPNNAAVSRLLIKHEQSKLRVLRQASSAIQI
jgi:tetratricopeptide (TPR) repeat protein